MLFKETYICLFYEIDRDDSNNRVPVSQHYTRLLRGMLTESLGEPRSTRALTLASQSVAVLSRGRHLSGFFHDLETARVTFGNIFFLLLFIYLLIYLLLLFYYFCELSRQ